MNRREELDARLLAVAARAVGFVGDDALGAKVEACGAESGKSTFHRDNPWLTTLYLQGILAGEDAQTDARKALLGDAARTESAPYRATQAEVDGTMSHTDGAPPRYGLDEARAVAAELDAACATEPNGMTARRRRRLAEARTAASVAWLDWLDEREREALGLEIDALGVLYDLCVAITYGMNRRGVGKVPALHVERRQTRDGDWIASSPDDIASADMILDSLAVQALLWFTGAARRGVSEVCDFEPVRRRVAEPDSPDYIVGMVQDAVAAVRGRELRAGGAPTLVKESLDAPVADDEGNERTLLDTLPTGDSDGERPDSDQARFFANVMAALSPKLFRYFKLIHAGTPKMKALEAIGAKSAHFVEREAKALVSELAKHDGDDFRELANLLVELCGK